MLTGRRFPGAAPRLRSGAGRLDADQPERPPRNSVWKLSMRVGGFASVGFLLFVFSAWLVPRWWEVDALPTAEQWSAFFGAFVLAALVIAIAQMKQVDESNRALADSNELQRKTNLELTRPRILVRLDVERRVTKKRSDPLTATVYLKVENVGQGTALGIRLQTDKMIESLDQFFKPGMKDEHLRKVNNIFQGESPIDTLHAGARYIWTLGFFPELFESDAIPRRYKTKVEYTSVAGETYIEDFVIDFDLALYSEFPVPPLTRIGKDLEVLGDKLERLNKTAHAIASKDTEVAYADPSVFFQGLLPGDPNEAVLREQDPDPDGPREEAPGND